MSTETARRPIYKRIGPGLITACVVIGPGSITTSSSIGANAGYSKLWVVIVSVIFMQVYMTMGARLGAVAANAPGDLIREKAGKWLAVLVGCSVFFISAAFQFGNNLGVAAAFQAFSGDTTLLTWLVIGFNTLAISFLFAFKNLYQMLERAMMAFVALMLISFAINLFNLSPSLPDMAAGFVPKATAIDLTTLGLVGTTFVITAAFYQAYLVRQKGWKVAEMRDGLIDARIGSVIMALITIMLMSTAAAGLHDGTEVKLGSPVDVAKALQATFGTSAKTIFCLGLFSAAYSSFLVNSMIGGFMAADGLGLGSKPSDLWPRLLTTLALVTGMTVGLATILFGFNPAPAIIAAQAVTVVAAPLVAGVLLWLTSRRDIMGDQVNTPVTTTFAGLGLVLLLAMAGKTAFSDIPKKIDALRNPPPAAQAESPAEAADEDSATPSEEVADASPAESETESAPDDGAEASTTSDDKTSESQE